MIFPADVFPHFPYTVRRTNALIFIDLHGSMENPWRSLPYAEPVVRGLKRPGNRQENSNVALTGVHKHGYYRIEFGSAICCLNQVPEPNVL